jgi:hypothetical protein
MLLAKEQSLPNLNVLGLTQPTRVRLKLMTSLMLSKSTTLGIFDSWEAHNQMSDMMTRDETNSSVWDTTLLFLNLSMMFDL